MTRWLLSAAALGTITGFALAAFGPNAAIGVAVCALAVIVFYGVQAARTDRERMRRYRDQVWQRRIDEAHAGRPELTIIKGGKEPEWLKQVYPDPGLLGMNYLKPWPIGDDEVRS